MTPPSFAISSQDFEAQWAQLPERRYGYALNRPLFSLYAVLLAGVWLYWGYKVASLGIDQQLVVVAALFGVVSLFTIGNALWWAFIGRSSGVVCGNDRLVWRYGKLAWSVPWTAVDFDALGLTVGRASDSQEYVLRVAGHPLVLFRPHLRLVNLETFLAMTFVALKEHGRIPVRGKRS